MCPSRLSRSTQVVTESTTVLFDTEIAGDGAARSVGTREYDIVDHKVLHERPPPSFWKEASEQAKKDGLAMAVVIDDYCLDHAPVRKLSATLSHPHAPDRIGGLPGRCDLHPQVC